MSPDREFSTVDVEYVTGRPGQQARFLMRGSDGTILFEGAGVLFNGLPIIAAPAPQSVTVTGGAGEATASLVYTDLATPGPSITIIAGASGTVLVQVSCRVKTNTAGDGGFMSISKDGGTPDDLNAAGFFQGPAATAYVLSRSTLFSGLVPGTPHTFTARYKANTGGSATFRDRRMIVTSL